MCRCVECLGIVGVYMYMCGVPRDCGCVQCFSQREGKMRMSSFLAIIL